MIFTLWRAPARVGSAYQSRPVEWVGGFFMVWSVLAQFAAGFMVMWAIGAGIVGVIWAVGVTHPGSAAVVVGWSLFLGSQIFAARTWSLAVRRT